MSTLKTAYCFTINNPTEGEKDLIKMLNLGEGKSEEKEKIRYMKYALETGEGETPHIQGYIHLFGQQRFSWLQKRLPRAAIFPTMGSVQQNVDYIGNPDFVHSEHAKNDKAGKRKGGSSLPAVEYGTLDGIRMDSRPNHKDGAQALMDVKKAIDEGMTEAELWEEHFVSMIRYGARVKEYMLVKKLSNHLEDIKEETERLRNERKRDEEREEVTLEQFFTAYEGSLKPPCQAASL